MAGTIAVAMSTAPAFARGQQPEGRNPSRQTHEGAQTHAQSEAKAGAKAQADHAFVLEAAKGGMAEVELGRLAADKATNDQVKKFGQRMVDDHSKANDELKSLAQTKSITIPSNLDPKYKSLHDRLSKLSGAEFDRAYMREMVSDHRKDVNAFRRESQSGQDPTVKAWAAKTLPTLEEHLKMAEEASKGAVGTSGSKNPGTSSTTGKTRTGNPPNGNSGSSREHAPNKK
jgi:putative membrane protein